MGSFQAGSRVVDGSIETFQFQPGEEQQPILVDTGVPGTLAIAWLQGGLRVTAGTGLLLGYVVLDASSSQPLTLHFYHLDATTGTDEETVPLTIRSPRDLLASAWR